MLAEAWLIISKKHIDENTVHERIVIVIVIVLVNNNNNNTRAPKRSCNNLECQLIDYEKIDELNNVSIVVIEDDEANEARGRYEKV